MLNNTIPEPWLSFLKAVDRSLVSKVSFHCFGGFAIKLLFGLPRETADVDIIASVVHDHYAELLKIAGKGSPLSDEFKVYLDLVGTIAVVPDDYEERLIPVTSPEFEHIRIYVMEPHDIVLAKLGRDAPKDIQDVAYLSKVADLDTDLLRQRYESELRHNVIGPPEREDKKLKYWIDTIVELRSAER
jgi:hypothetical protein